MASSCVSICAFLNNLIIFVNIIYPFSKTLSESYFMLWRLTAMSGTESEPGAPSSPSTDTAERPAVATPTWLTSTAHFRWSSTTTRRRDSSRTPSSSSGWSTLMGTRIAVLKVNHPCRWTSGSFRIVATRCPSVAPAPTTLRKCASEQGRRMLFEKGHANLKPIFKQKIRLFLLTLQTWYLACRYNKSSWTREYKTWGENTNLKVPKWRLKLAKNALKCVRQACTVQKTTVQDAGRGAVFACVTHFSAFLANFRRHFETFRLVISPQVLYSRIQLD